MIFLNFSFLTFFFLTEYPDCLILCLLLWNLLYLVAIEIQYFLVSISVPILSINLIIFIHCSRFSRIYFSLWLQQFTTHISILKRVIHIILIRKKVFFKIRTIVSKIYRRLISAFILNLRVVYIFFLDHDVCWWQRWHSFSWKFISTIVGE